MSIQRNNITQQLINYMKEQIQTGHWAVNERVPSENELSAELGVSRASVHSAFQQFIAMGTMESIQGKGTFLRANSVDFLGSSHMDQVSKKDILEYLRLRQLIEPQIAYEAALSMTEETIADLRECYEQMKKNVGDSSLFARYDMKFHSIITKSLNNAKLDAVMDIIYAQNVYSEKLSSDLGYHGLFDHAGLIQRLSLKDAEGARKIMKKQLEDAIIRVSSAS